MNYRLSTLHPSEAYTANITEVIDINVADPISALTIALKVGNTASAAPTAHAMACLTKIEIVDGSDVLFSLSGRQAEALDWYCNGVQRSNWNAYLNGMDTDRHVGINFGRWLWDPILALDPKKFTNLQLKFTLDYDAGGCAPDENTIEIWACLFDEKKVEPTGFLMAKEIKEFAGTSSATHEYSDLPTDHPYRKLLIRAQEAGEEPGALLSNLKLSEDQDKRVVFNHGFGTIMRNIALHTPIYAESIIGYVGTSSTNGYCTPTTRINGICQEWKLEAPTGSIAFYEGDGGEFQVIHELAGSNMQVELKGWLPHGVWDIPFGDQKDIEDWYDVTKIGSLRADITKTSTFTSSMAAQIFLQQMRKYA